MNQPCSHVPCSHAILCEVPIFLILVYLEWVHIIWVCNHWKEVHYRQLKVKHLMLEGLWSLYFKYIYMQRCIDTCCGWPALNCSQPRPCSSNIRIHWTQSLLYYVAFSLPPIKYTIHPTRKCNSFGSSLSGNISETKRTTREPLVNREDVA